MRIEEAREYAVRGLTYRIRSAAREDAAELAQVRLQIDGETENMDRESGEAYLDPSGFEALIVQDTVLERNLFLIAEANGRIAGFSRCEGSSLNRLKHKVEFGVCVLQAYWGHGIGRSLLAESIAWADANGLKKISLSVLETNEKAIRLYQSLGFEMEGWLRKDKLLADGRYYDTLVMGRWRD
ncbi:GNAT family N-acetyltransferase [Gorillibacterium sp. sgz500922]|uniref:GNAT family N-acetyltransferase n=1 Tax=Gorillibacterium sp. sgz500922 TaxID=3446694 RepID=UPI003F6745AE